MNAADTSASSAIADCTPLTVVSRSPTTAEIDTFISDVSTTSTNIAIANSSASRPGRPEPSAAGAGSATGVPVIGAPVIVTLLHRWAKPDCLARRRAQPPGVPVSPGGAYTQQPRSP